MKRIIAIILASVLVLTSCGKTQNIESNKGKNEGEQSEQDGSIITKQPEIVPVESDDEVIFPEDKEISFSGLNDTALLQYVEDNIYAGLVECFSSEDYIIENVSAIYVSNEYLAELEYNSKSNIFFGYTLEELDAQFHGTRYVFTLGDNGETVVEPFSGYDDTYERALKNIAFGTGLILICVTVSVVSGGLGAPEAVSMVFASAARTGTTFALSSGALSTVAAATVTALSGGDFEEVKKTAALAGSEGFKWGAISGIVMGGAKEALSIYHSATTIPTPRESEIAVLNKTKGGVEQVSYLGGMEVPKNTQGATRPDVVIKNLDGTVKAIEVKNYDLQNANSRNTLFSELKRQVADRVQNLPAGSTQEIVLDVRGRGFGNELINDTVKLIKNMLSGVYPNIPVEIMRY